MATIVVTDGDERSALAVVRSLGAAGHTVVVASDSGRSIAGASKHAVAEHRVLSPLCEPDAFFDALTEVVRELPADVLIPIGEAALRAILPRREELGETRIPFPSEDVFRRVCDKDAVLAAARELGIPDPTIAVAESHDALDATASGLSSASYPLVLKPTRSVVRGRGSTRKTSVRYVPGPEELEAAAESLDPHEFPVLVQRKVEGPGIGVFLLVSRGEVLAAFGHRRIREKPPAGGVSVLRESIEIPPQLLEASTALLAALEWEGVAMVEYKLDRASGEHVLMEINGRFWGSLQLAIDAGVDFPELLVRVALGDRPEPQPVFRVGVRTRWLMGDFDHLMARLRKSRRGLGLGPSAPGRVRVAVDFLAGFLPPTRSEVFRWSDPRPAVREVTRWLRASLGSRDG